MVMQVGPPPPRRKLAIEELVLDEAIACLDTWWVGLHPRARGTARWVFTEPQGLAMPRQRARFSIADSLGPHDPPHLGGEAPHNRSHIFRPPPARISTIWKDFALKTTNQTLQQVQNPGIRNAEKTWLAIMAKSHAGLLRPGAIDVLERWQAAGPTERQKNALSEALWSLSNFMTQKRGKTEYKSSYGPKLVTGGIAMPFRDPFFSSLGRPSSAPIAHPAHRKFEAAKKATEENNRTLALSARATIKARPATAAVRAHLSSIQLGTPGCRAAYESTSQAMQRSIKPTERLESLMTTQKCRAACPPVTTLSRHLGEPPLHGDSMYNSLWPTAVKTFVPLEKTRRPPEYFRMKRYVV